MQHNLKGIWRMLASDLEGRIRFLCLRKHHPLISFLSYDSGVGGELAESLIKERRLGEKRLGFTYYNSKFVSLGKVSLTIGRRTQIVTALKVCVYCLVFFNAERIQG